MSITAARGRCATAMSMASSIPAEMTVPAVNVFDQGFVGNDGRKPGTRCGGSVK